MASLGQAGEPAGPVYAAPVSPSHPALDSVATEYLLCFPASAVVGATPANAALTIPIASATGGHHLFPRTVTAYGNVVQTSLLATPTIVRRLADSTSAPTKGLGLGATPSAPSASATAIADGARQDARQLDPVNGPFLGGVPTTTIDVPITALFLLVFTVGALAHLTIYQRNAKRGQKYLLTSLVFYFCATRIITCTSRIIWAFASSRAAIASTLVAEIVGQVSFDYLTEASANWNRDAIVFAANVFFARRIIRLMRPELGRDSVFTLMVLLLVLSIPANIILNIVSISISILSFGNSGTTSAAQGAFIFGTSWNLALSVTPLILLFITCAAPTPLNQLGNTATSRLRVQACVMVSGVILLATGAATRLAALANPTAGLMDNPLFSKGTFYATGFLLEAIVVGIYAYFRVDLFPSPSKEIESTTQSANEKRAQSRVWTVENIEAELMRVGIHYEILKFDAGAQPDSLYAILYTGARSTAASKNSWPQLKNARMSRIQSRMPSLRPARPPRASRRTPFMTAKAPQLPPSQFDWD
ncbi:hypothetical protein HIM_08251 [Hirsutella minnesotensis 3608]|uniref:Uncharacterized protein n=1 Tax=Hirsutella minnesotensis 3608 TaxID=1043627 RepID=A0A0F7ZMN8_9HYPO|nr:hypothetical protein HIM_08251 [Hirsutella minnesotensis 3608]